MVMSWKCSEDAIRVTEKFQLIDLVDTSGCGIVNGTVPANGNSVAEEGIVTIAAAVD